MKFNYSVPNFDTAFAGLNADIDAIREQARKISESSQLAYEDSVFSEMSEDITERLKEYIDIHIGKEVSTTNRDTALALQSIATSLEVHVSVMREQLDLNIKEAESAKKDARFSKVLSIIAIIVSIVAIVAQVLF